MLGIFQNTGYYRGQSVVLLFISVAISCISFSSRCYSQAPAKLLYQFIVKDVQGRPLENRAVFLRCSIKDSAITGPVIYAEIHQAITLPNGIVSIVLGDGVPSLGVLDEIPWSTRDKFLSLEIDTTNTGGNYYEVGSQQLLSVPYALYSGNSIPSGGTEGEVLTFDNGELVWADRSRFADLDRCNADNLFNPTLSYQMITDQDGNQYKTITIGSQEWMAENLKVGHFRNGDDIPLVNDSASWSGLIASASCWYNNDSASYACPYGKLYNYYAVTDSRGLCPSGWHVPSISEWGQLASFLAGSGAALKASSVLYWSNPISGANSSGFSGIPGGCRVYTGSFDGIGGTGYWWSTSYYGYNNAWNIDLVNSGSVVGQNPNHTNDGFSVRCVKD